MREELIRLEKVLQLVKDAVGVWINQDNKEQQLGMDIFTGIQDVNREIFGLSNLADAFVEAPVDKEDCFAGQVDKWLIYLQKELEIRKKIKKKIDYDFYVLTQHIRLSDEKELLQEEIGNLCKIRQRDGKLYQQIIMFHNAYSHLWGKIDLDKGVWDILADRAFQLKEHLEDFCWLYEELGDYRSKKVLYGILHFWLTFDYKYKSTLRENNYSDYYDFDLLSCDENEVLVDLGAYTGDSALSYIENFGVYKKLYCYEITESSLESMKERLEPYENIVIRNVAAGEENTTMYLQSQDSASSGNRIGEEEGIPVKVVRLDDDIEEAVTFIKMDIEGSELAALKGAKEHIRKDKPKLAICTYHNNHHIWEVPRLMKELNPDYKLYMRYNGNIAGLAVSEFVTFAL